MLKAAADLIKAVESKSEDSVAAALEAAFDAYNQDSSDEDTSAPTDAE